jgi:hypothetical protein
MKKLILAMSSLGLLSNISAVQAGPHEFTAIGCGTVVEAHAVNEKPDYVYPMYQPKSNSLGTVGQVVSQLPGIGLLAGAVIAIAGSAAIDGVADAVKDNDLEKAEKKNWEGVQSITIKPDFGEQFTVNYLVFYKDTYSPGDRIQVAVSEFISKVDGSIKLVLATRKNTWTKVPEFSVDEYKQYKKVCFNGYDNGGVPIVYRDGKLQKGEITPEIQAFMDAGKEKTEAENK